MKTMKECYRFDTTGSCSDEGVLYFEFKTKHPVDLLQFESMADKYMDSRYKHRFCSQCHPMLELIDEGEEYEVEETIDMTDF